ncbi:MAG: rRNA maturation RNase YbeY [Firmicutes bacterium]|nr:rRNA maturation RNase YbeY [Bacillota bacterium]
MNEVEIINEVACDFEELEELNDYIAFVLKKEQLEHVLFNVIFVDNEYIHKINLEYRGIDRPTDVITFALEDEKTMQSGNIRVLGDIYISVDKVVEQAKEYGHSRRRELFFLVTHGIYHLLGFDHMNEHDAKIMFEKQEQVLNEYGIKRETNEK